MSEHHSNQFKMVDIFYVRKVLIMLVQLVLLSSYLSLIEFCEAHAPLHRIYYGPHRFHQSPSSIPSSLISSLASSSSSSSPNIDLSLFGNRFIDPQSLSAESNHDHRSENDLLSYSQSANSVNSIPSCNQLKYLWKEANRLAINLYGPDFAFSHPKLHANPFYLTNLLLRKHHHTHSFGGAGSGSGSDKGVFIEPEPISFKPVLVRPTFEIVDNSDDKGSSSASSLNDIYSDIGEFGSIQDRLSSTGSISSASGQNGEGPLPSPPVPGQFSDYTIPKNDLGAIYGNIVLSPDQLHHSSPTSLSSSSTISSSSKSPQLVTSSLQSPSSLSSTPRPSSSSSSSRKDAKHRPKLGFGAVVSNSKETYDSNPDESSHRAPESSKKVDNFFNLGFWHDTPIDLS